MGALVMHQSRCIAVSAEGGFKINGPPKNGKGPMHNEEDQELSNKASPPKPTQAGRIETCTELIRQVTKCLENNDKQCVTRLIEELIKANCHDGRLIGKVVADKVRDVVHGLWLISDSGEVCRLLMLLRNLGTSKNWVREALGMNSKDLNKRLAKCGIDWESRAARNDIVKEIEDLLREKFGWSETKMCEELFKFIGIDVNEFRRYGIEPCIWLEGLEELSDLKKPYWFGLRASDLTVREFDDIISLEIDTTSSVDAVFFPTLLNTVKTPSLAVKWKREAPAAKYVRKAITLEYYVDLGLNEWPWPINLNADELEKILNSLSDGGLAMFVAGVVDGDGSVWSKFGDDNIYVYVGIATCKSCPKRTIDVLKEVIARRFGIVGHIHSNRTDDVLTFYGENAVRLLRRVVRYIHHPIKRLRAELILALYDGKISREAFEKLYEMTEYEYGGPDVKRNNALAAAARAAPQTHTHGEAKTKNMKCCLVRPPGFEPGFCGFLLRLDRKAAILDQARLRPQSYFPY